MTATMTSDMYDSDDDFRYVVRVVVMTRFTVTAIMTSDMYDSDDDFR